jgi:hypothetical protein
MFDVLFYLYPILLVSGRYYSAAAIHENLQYHEEQDFEQLQAGK